MVRSNLPYPGIVEPKSVYKTEISITYYIVVTALLEYIDRLHGKPAVITAKIGLF